MYTILTVNVVPVPLRPDMTWLHRCSNLTEWPWKSYKTLHYLTHNVFILLKDHQIGRSQTRRHEERKGRNIITHTVSDKNLSMIHGKLRNKRGNVQLRSLNYATLKGAKETNILWCSWDLSKCKHKTLCETTAWSSKVKTFLYEYSKYKMCLWQSVIIKQ